MIAIESDLIAESPAMRVRFIGSGSTVTAHLEGSFGSLGALRHARSVAPLARAIVPLLVGSGLTLDIIVGTVRVARAGAGIESNGLARMLDIANLHIGR